MDERRAMTALRETHGHLGPIRNLRKDKDQASRTRDASSTTRPESAEVAVPGSGTPALPGTDTRRRHSTSVISSPCCNSWLPRVASLADPSQSELELARDMTDTLLVIGLDQAEYARLIRISKTSWAHRCPSSRSAGPSTWRNYWPFHPCPESETRLRLVLGVIEECATTRPQAVAHRKPSSRDNCAKTTTSTARPNCVSNGGDTSRRRDVEY